MDPKQFLLNPQVPFTEMDKLILKFIRNFKKHQKVKTIQKKNKVRKLTLPISTYYEAIVINNTVWNWHLERHSRSREYKSRNKAKYSWSNDFNMVPSSNNRGSQQIVLSTNGAGTTRYPLAKGYIWIPVSQCT